MKKVSFSRIKDRKAYFLKKLNAGDIIAKLLINDTEQLVEALELYMIDKEAESVLTAYAGPYVEEYKRSVLVSKIIPYYAFNDKENDKSSTDIDVEDLAVNILDKMDAVNELNLTDEIIDFISNEEEGSKRKLHYEYYMIKKGTDNHKIEETGGILEIEIVENWMELNGYYPIE